MSATRSASTAAALRRFGLGARPGDVARIGRDARGAVLAELRSRSLALTPVSALFPTATLYAQKMRWEQTRASLAAGLKVDPDPVIQPERPRFFEEVAARQAAWRVPLVGINERLVSFWANHFAISMRKSGWVGVVAGAYEREVVRPHLFGRFEDMLLASGRHYAMLAYLDNAASRGPNSPQGRAEHAGLNENYAREVLELHTLGVGGGYTQADVTALAHMLTGWTLKGAGTSEFAFIAEAHEPGPQTFLGQTVPPAPGMGQGEAALQAAIHHPSTARFIAAKLARHFVADDPPPALVSRLADSFQRTGGDLPALYQALATAPEAWTGFGTKLRTPQQFVAAALRATGAEVSPVEIYALLTAMGQSYWNPAGPDGYSDTLAEWAAPVTLKARVDVAFALAAKVTGGPTPAALAHDLFGDLATPETLEALQHAPTPREGLALLLLSPEFQRS